MGPAYPGEIARQDAQGGWFCDADRTHGEAAVDGHLAGRYADAGAVQAMQSELHTSAGLHADLASRLAVREVRVAALVQRLAALSRPAGYVRIPPGTFVMGSPPDEAGRDPSEVQHTVTISRPFWLKTTEVTRAEWQAVMTTVPPHHAACGDDCPVVAVSWDEAVAYVNALSRSEGLAECYTGAPGSWTALDTGGLGGEVRTEPRALPIPVVNQGMGARLGELQAEELALVLAEDRTWARLEGALSTAAIIETIVAIGGFEPEGARRLVADLLGHTPETLPQRVPFSVEYDVQ